jgi:hypothetical protein
VLLSPKDREALRDFKARMEEGGEKISFFEALRLRLGGASHLHGLAMESIASTPRLENLLHNLEQARAVENRPLPPDFLGELRPTSRAATPGCTSWSTRASAPASPTTWVSARPCRRSR